MSTPYNKEARNLQASAGEATVWEVDFPTNMRINRFVLLQTGGNAPGIGNIIVTLFNSRRAVLPSASSGGADPAGDYTASPRLYQALPRLRNDNTIPHDDAATEDTENQLIRFWQTGYVYTNQDGSVSNRDRKIYVHIDLPAGSGLTTWDLSIGGDRLD